MSECYVCVNCGFIFGEDGIETIQFQECPGASVQKEFVSACCHSNYEVRE